MENKNTKQKRWFSDWRKHLNWKSNEKKKYFKCGWNQKPCGRFADNKKYEMIFLTLFQLKSIFHDTQNRLWDNVRAQTVLILLPVNHVLTQLDYPPYL